MTDFLYAQNLSYEPVELPHRAVVDVVRLAKILYRLSCSLKYRQLLRPDLPEIARFDPGNDSVMMGYDFHMTEEGPKLIEVNTNAGAALLAFLAHKPAATLQSLEIPEKTKNKIISTFYDVMAAFSQGRVGKPQHIVIVDENPADQFLYIEMLAFKALFEQYGICASVVAPGELDADSKGVFLRGLPVDMLYMRHCDFYLESEEMAGIRAAYLAKTVCLTPCPLTYGLLSDKRRLANLSNPDFLAEAGLNPKEIDLVLRIIPEAYLLSSKDMDDTWRQRKRWVFKPVSGFGSQGVFYGRKISRVSFADLDVDNTLVQKLVPASKVTLQSGEEMKVDFRLFAYRSQSLGVAARLYQGRITNMRTVGGGFAPVKIVR